MITMNHVCIPCILWIDAYRCASEISWNNWHTLERLLFVHQYNFRMAQFFDAHLYFTCTWRSFILFYANWWAWWYLCASDHYKRWLIFCNLASQQILLALRFTMFVERESCISSPCIRFHSTLQHTWSVLNVMYPMDSTRRWHNWIFHTIFTVQLFQECEIGSQTFRFVIAYALFCTPMILFRWYFEVFL